MLLQLRHIQDIRTIVFTFTYFTLFLIQWCITWNTNTSLLCTLPMWFATCWFSFVAAVATHNCIHCPMFTNKTANKVFQILLSLAYGHPVSSYVPGHNLSHHKYTQQTKDVMRTTKVRYRWHLLNGLTFFFKVGYDMIGNDSTYFKVQSALGRPIYKQLCIEQIILYTIAASLAIWDFKRWLILAFLPHVYAKFCIITLNLLQHDGCDMSSRYNFSRNFTGFWINWFCYNNGYHTIHHLYPGMHWTMLPSQHNALLKPHMHENLEQPNILIYIFRTFIFPGIRIDYLGAPLILPPQTTDEPWFYEDQETYSTKEHYQ